MQLATHARKWLVILASAGYLAVGILLLLKGDQILGVIRGINGLDKTEIVSGSFHPELVQNTWEVTEADDLPDVRFAVIGDYGTGQQPEADVAVLVKSWNPDFIITTGDNNYPEGEATTIDQNIGQFFHEFIFPYNGGYGDGAVENHFFPSLGNHDWNSENAQPYLDYFTLPGNERYYEFVRGPVHFFVLDSDKHEPDGVESNSAQAVWLQSQMTNSDSPWKIVYMHHPPFSSGLHGSIDWMQWPFAEWGADAVISGHDHTYERISRDRIIYFVNGLGGRSKYLFFGKVEGSQVRYNEDYGAMRVEASEDNIRFQFINRQAGLIDAVELTQLTASLFLPVIYRNP
ncbi:metallophosphoesterase family protein [Chloroflexota bacterium]